MGPQDSADLRATVRDYLGGHHTMTVATAGPADGEPHAATVFYALDDDLRLIFLSKPTSVHGRHIGGSAPVAVTVSEEYEDWESIRGVQLWGEARILSGAAKAAALLVYMRRFPFVRDLMKSPQLSETLREIGVYRVEPRRVAFTDNASGVFGRKILELVRE